jgi:hypothetical protein
MLVVVAVTVQVSLGSTLPVCTQVTISSPSQPLYYGMIQVYTPFATIVGGPAVVATYSQVFMTGTVANLRSDFWPSSGGRMQALHQQYNDADEPPCILPITTAVLATSEALKSDLLMLHEGPPLAFTTTPTQPLLDEPFTITVLGDWTTLVGYSFMLTSDPWCAAAVQAWSTGNGTAVVLNATAVALSVTPIVAPAGRFVALSLCVSLESSAEVTPYFPLSQFAGHSNHNIYVGNGSVVDLHTAANVSWLIPGVQQLENSTRNYLMFGTLVDIYLTAGWVASTQFTHFGFDATLSLCYPGVATAFTASNVTALNSTFDIVRGVNVSAPNPDAGGGRIVLCGSTGPSAPWVLLSYDWYAFMRCSFGTVRMSLEPEGQTSCSQCGPLPPQDSCNWHGMCGLWNECFESNQLLCYCFKGYTGLFLPNENNNDPCPIVTRSATRTEDLSDSRGPSITPTASPTNMANADSRSITPPPFLPGLFDLLQP